MGKFFRAVGRGIKKTFTTKTGLLAVAGGAALAFVPGLAPTVLKGVAAASRSIATVAKTTGSLVKKGVSSSLVRGIAKRFAQQDEPSYTEYTPPFVEEPYEEWQPQHEYRTTGDSYVDYDSPGEQLEPQQEDAAEYYRQMADDMVDSLVVVREADGSYFLVDERTQTAYELDDDAVPLVLQEMRAA
jgi:hypothetical protein